MEQTRKRQHSSSLVHSIKLQKSDEHTSNALVCFLLCEYLDDFTLISLIRTSKTIREKLFTYPNIQNRLRWMKIDHYDNGHTKGNHFLGGYRCQKGVSQGTSPPVPCPIPSTIIMNLRFIENMAIVHACEYPLTTIYCFNHPTNTFLWKFEIQDEREAGFGLTSHIRFVHDKDLNCLWICCKPKLHLFSIYQLDMNNGSVIKSHTRETQSVTETPYNDAHDVPSFALYGRFLALQDTTSGSLMLMDKNSFQVLHTIQMLEESESFKIVSYENPHETPFKISGQLLPGVAIWEESGKVTIAWGSFWSVQVAHIEEISLKATNANPVVKSTNRHILPCDHILIEDIAFFSLYDQKLIISISGEGCRTGYAGQNTSRLYIVHVDTGEILFKIQQPKSDDWANWFITPPMVFKNILYVATFDDKNNMVEIGAVDLKNMAWKWKNPFKEFVVDDDYQVNGSFIMSTKTGKLVFNAFFCGSHLALIDAETGTIEEISTPYYLLPHSQFFHEGFFYGCKDDGHKMKLLKLETPSAQGVKFSYYGVADWNGGHVCTDFSQFTGKIDLCD